MISRISVTVAAAAALALGGISFAQNDASGNQNAGQNTQNAQPGAEGQTGAENQTGAEGQTGATAGQSGSQNRDMIGGERAEMQLQRDLRQIAQNPTQDAADKLFVIEAAQGNLQEEQLGQAAQQKAQNQQVKELAQRITQDHQKLQQQLQPIAESMGVRLPQSISRTEQEKINVLAALPADQFDKQFTVDAEANHAKDILQYQAEAQTAQNSQLKQYAQQSLPMLQEHARLADQSAQALGLPNAAEAVTAGFKIAPNGSNANQSQNGTQSQNPSENQNQNQNGSNSGQSGQNNGQQ